MKNKDPLSEKLAILKPETLLDTGCGCGSYTAVDISGGLVK